MYLDHDFRRAMARQTVRIKVDGPTALLALSNALRFSKSRRGLAIRCGSASLHRLGLQAGDRLCWGGDLSDMCGGVLSVKHYPALLIFWRIPKQPPGRREPRLKYPNAFLQVPGVSLPNLFRIDIMHTRDLGTTQKFLGLALTRLHLHRQTNMPPNPRVNTP